MTQNKKSASRKIVFGALACSFALSLPLLASVATSSTANTPLAVQSAYASGQPAIKIVGGGGANDSMTYKYKLVNADGYTVSAQFEGPGTEGRKLVLNTDKCFVNVTGEQQNPGQAYVVLTATKDGNTISKKVSVYFYGPSTARYKANYYKMANGLGGETAEDTMRNIVEKAFPNPTDQAVLATSDGYWDALGANALAGSMKAPVLLCHFGELPQQTVEELKRLNTKHVTICGGEHAVSAAVEQQLNDMGIKTSRVYGESISDTANEIAGKLGKSDTAFVATSWGYQDALSAASYAYARQAPIFLTNYNTARLDDSSIEVMKKKGVKQVYLIGGKAVVSPDVEAQLKKAGIAVERVAGDSAYDTSAQLAEKLISLGMSANNLGVATGYGYTDALAGAALCGTHNSVLLLADDSNQTTVDQVVAAHKDKIQHYYVLGGSSVIGSDVQYAFWKVFK